MLNSNVSFGGNMRLKMGISLVMIELLYGWSRDRDKLGTLMICRKTVAVLEGSYDF
jgi:hypothetical protein